MKALDVRTRIQLKNILFATDFSPASDGAVPYASALAKHYGANLYALHVRPPIVNPMTPPVSWKSLEEAANRESELDRQKLRNSFAGLQPEILINEGDLWSNIEAVMKEVQIDLIVMGTRGRSGVARFILGSTAERIFRQSPCPVLTVGPHSSAGSKPNGEFFHILFATDFSPESIAAAPFAISLAQEYQAYLTLLHVVEEPKANELVQPSDLTASSAQLLHNLVPADAELWCVPQYVVERGDAGERILDVATRSKTDLIVLGVKQPSGFPGAATHLPIAIAHSVVSRAACPVLTVRG
jgi:nucleotide-binding universal stress UspA family protein